jgi:ankyrin repeat protein
MCEILLWKGSFSQSLNMKDSVGETPLHDAARIGHVGCARLLLSRGAEVDACNDSGESPLLLPIRKGMCNSAEC